MADEKAVTAINKNSIVNTSLYKIYRTIQQITIVVFFLETFFATAKMSPIYSEWNEAVRSFFDSSLIACSVVFAVLFAVSIYLFIVNKLYKDRTWDIFLYGSFIIVQYLLRLTMVGTLQMDEGLTSYTYLRNLSLDPSPLITNFIEAGKMSGRTAYGYIFFCLIGEFMEPLTGNGFQWMHIYLAIGVSCCVFGILKELFYKVNTFVLWIAAMVISFQPMFLGFSTMCSIEYGLLAFFIFAFYCYVKERYILMAFWVIMLGTCKSIGLIMALCFVFSIVAAKLACVVFKSLETSNADANTTDEDALEDEESSSIDYKSIFIVGAVILVGIILFLVIRKICIANGIEIDLEHIGLKLAQLYILNFAWIWTIVVLVGMVMIVANKRVKKTNIIAFKPLFVLLCAYLVHTAYLIFYPKSVLPRYDLLSDMLFVIFGVFILFKLFVRKRAVLTVLAVVGTLMLGEAFVTIDPVSADVFTNVNTNGLPLLYTASFKKNTPLYDDNAGDFSYYNHHFTFFDKAIDEIVGETIWKDEIRILTVYSGTETQFEDSNVVWDAKLKKRTYRANGEFDRYMRIKKNSFDSYIMAEGDDAQAVLIISPGHSGDDDLALAFLAENYEIAGPFLCDRGYAGKVVYYNLTHK